MSNLKISVRLGAAFTLISLLIAFLGVTTFNILSSVSEEWNNFDSVSMKKREAATQGMIKLGDGVHHFKNFLIRTGNYDKQFGDDMDAIDAAIARYKSVGMMSEREIKMLDEVSQGVQAYRAAITKLKTLKAEGKDINEIDKAIKGADKPIGVAFTELLKFAEQDTEATGALLEKLVRNGTYWIVALNVFTIALAALCAWIITRSIVLPLNEAVHVAKTVASGDLTSHIEVRSADETGQLLQALKDMNANLIRIVGEVRNGTQVIMTSSSEIARGNADFSSRTEQEASALEETASSLEELTSTVKQNATNANQANVLAEEASEVAVKGGAVVSQVVDTMSSIDESSKKIVDIISVIDGIAFQTNILALNAAVEAARAGEQGRGFAVVASEVRSLAQRSASAAKEIKELINDSVGKVADGTKLVEQAGVTMDEVVASVKRVTGIINEIAIASQEQTSGIEQINTAIIHLDQTTQQNAALVEEASASTAFMQNQATSLAQAVSVFKLNNAHQLAH